MTEPIVALSTLQFTHGGLLDATRTDNLVHLVRAHRTGTPGPTLCGIDRFAPTTPGWSVGGGVDGPGMVHTPCPGCVTVARDQFPGLPIAGMKPVAEPVAAALGVERKP